MFEVLNSYTIQIHGAGGHGGISGAVGDMLAFIESLVAMQPPEIFGTLFPGVAAMHNVHPMFVHFPIAFLLAFFLLDTCASITNRERWRYVAGWLLYLGAASAIVAVALGLHAAATVPHGENVHEIMERHEHFGLAVLTLALLLSVWRWLGKRSLHGAANILYLSMAAIMIVCLSLGADLGGLMVYHYGINVGIEPPPESISSEVNHAHNH